MYASFFLNSLSRVGISTPVVFEHEVSLHFWQRENLNLRLNTANFRVSGRKIQLCDLII